MKVIPSTYISDQFDFTFHRSGFFFGGSSCNCPPPAPPPVCQSACDGGFPAPPPPPPLLQTYNQRGSYYQPQQQIQAPQIQGSYALPQGPVAHQIISPPAPAAPPSSFIQPPPVDPVHELGASKGTYVNPHVPSNHPLRFESLEPPTPPPLSLKHVESKKKEDNFLDYGDEGDAIVPPITTPAPPPESAAYSRAQDQIEVVPTMQYQELSFDKVPEDVDLLSKVVNKIEKPISTTTPPTATEFFSSTSLSLKTSKMATAMYEDKIPDIDGLNENSSKSMEKMNDLLANDYSDNSYRAKVAGVKSRLENDVSGRDAKTDVKCGDTILRELMLENIVNSPTISKQLIFSAGKMKFKRPIDVVCSRNKFSYTVVSSKVYCEVTKRPVTCFAFFQP
ncbi:hypothetical protein FO519_006945 [Halicephalobus sp. NKZ332]|nr:hypothetical protein FO519_006945 [Halicephalobus sp. NKZ332]